MEKTPRVGKGLCPPNHPTWRMISFSSRRSGCKISLSCVYIATDCMYTLAHISRARVDCVFVFCKRDRGVVGPCAVVSGSPDGRGGVPYAAASPTQACSGLDYFRLIAAYI